MSTYLLYSIDSVLILNSVLNVKAVVAAFNPPTRAFSWLKAATTAFTFKTLLRRLRS